MQNNVPNNKLDAALKSIKEEIGCSEKDISILKEILQETELKD